MITKKILPLFAMLAVFVIIAVPYSSAAGNKIVEHSIELAVDSENQDRYDSVVNLADPSTAVNNPDTWTPSPQGIWLGASTEESLFQFSEVVPANNWFVVRSAVKFNSTQIMNGASVTVIRSPISSEGVASLTITIDRLSSPDDWNPSIYGRVASVDVNMSDTSVTSGGDYWTVDGRTYVELHAPIYAGVYYLITWRATYYADSQPAIYLSSQDVANDELVRTEVDIHHYIDPDNPYEKQYSWDIEPGISYDMRQGLGSGLYSESKYVRSGDILRFSPLFLLYTGGSYYHTLMMPFATDDHTLEAKVQLIQGKDPDENYNVIWEDDRTDWVDYILACSPTELGSITGGNLWVQITLLESKRVNFMFIDTPSISNQENQASFILDGQKHTVFARPWASYQMSAFALTAPSLDPADFPALPEVVENQQMNWFGSLIGVALILVGAALIPIGLGVPVMIAGAAMIGTGVSLLILDEIAHNKGYSGVGEYLGGIFRNALDDLWEGLEGVGNFLHAVGEAIWDALVWFADSITEYGSVLLGLAIIAFSLGLFFLPIFAQVKLWAMFLELAKGNYKGAAAQAQGLADTASSAVGKLRGR